MAKLSKHSAHGTSFYNTVIKTSVNELIRVLGQPQFEDNTGEDKTNFDFVCETKDGDVFTIYDWKYYRPIDKDEMIEFHIGGKASHVTQQARIELLILLAK